MNQQIRPEPTLADPEATMRMLRERAGGDAKALACAEEWGRKRARRLPILRRFAALLARHGIVGPDTNRIERDFVVAQCLAIATRHGLDKMGYWYLDGRLGPLASLLDIDLHAVELDGTDPGSLFPTDADEREFLERVRGKTYGELGRMAREIVIPERERLTFP